jgi:hypothetical protein
MTLVWKSGSLNLLEPSGPVQRLLYLYLYQIKYLLFILPIFGLYFREALPMDTKFRKKMLPLSSGSK